MLFFSDDVQILCRSHTVPTDFTAGRKAGSYHDFTILVPLESQLTQRNSTLKITSISDVLVFPSWLNRTHTYLIKTLVASRPSSCFHIGHIAYPFDVILCPADLPRRSPLSKPS